MAIGYTSFDRVKLYGDVRATGSDALIAELIAAYSRAMDNECNMAFSESTYTDVVQRAVIDRDGTLTTYTNTPTIRSISSIAYRAGASSAWQALPTSSLDIEEADHGCVIRVLDTSLSGVRGQRARVQLSYVGGWADLTEVPADFEILARRLVWWAFKLREAPMEKTAIPQLGIVVVPQAWPPDVKQGLRNYRRVVPL